MPDTVHVANMTIQQFSKTLEGQSIIASMDVFCLGTDLWQGIKGGGYTLTYEKLLTDEELEAAHDIEGTKDTIWANRKSRGASRQYRKKEELSRREEEKSNQRLKDLQLQKLEQELLGGSTPTPNIQLAPTVETQAVTHLDPVSEQPVSTVACSECDKVSPAGHKNPHGWLMGHKMGAHRKR